jgi:hypothetical protein
MFVLAAGLLAAGLVPRPGAATIPVGRWIAGDLTLHSTYSDDVCGIPPVFFYSNLAADNCDANGDGNSAAPTNVGWTPIQLVQEAQKRGLQFVAITDTDSAAAQTDPEIQTYKACHVETPDTCPVLVLDGTSKPLQDAGGFASGRVSAVGYSAPKCDLGQTGCVDNPDPLGPFPADPTPANGWTANDLNASIATVHLPRADGTPGGIVFADRPAAPAFTYDAAALTLDAWNVWDGSYLDQSEFTGSSAADNPQADSAWMGAETSLTALGRRLPVIGGSDARYQYTQEINGPGQPTLWLWDTLDDPDGAVTWAGIRDAIEHGRTSIGSPPSSSQEPTLSLETADENYMSGDTLPDSGNHQVRVLWQNAPVGAKIRIVGVIGSNPIRVGAVPFTVTITSSTSWAYGPSLQFLPGRWYRAELYVDDDPAAPAPAVPTRSGMQCMPVWPTPNSCLKDRYLMIAITGPIFAPAPAAH